jgi:hypothetical protein
MIICFIEHTSDSQPVTAFCLEVNQSAVTVSKTETSTFPTSVTNTTQYKLSP